MPRRLLLLIARDHRAHHVPKRLLLRSGHSGASTLSHRHTSRSDHRHGQRFRVPRVFERHLLPSRDHQRFFMCPWHFQPALQARAVRRLPSRDLSARERSHRLPRLSGWLVLRFTLERPHRLRRWDLFERERRIQCGCLPCVSSRPRMRHWSTRANAVPAGQVCAVSLISYVLILPTWHVSSRMERHSVCDL